MKNLIFVLLSVFILEIKAQDSLPIKELVRIRKNEIGLNVLPLFIAISGASSNYNDLFNFTYRRLLKPKHALRITSGIYLNGNDWSNGYPLIVSKSNSVTVYQTNYSTGRVNVQSGIGYEYILGKRKLKHVFGCDLTYNYQKVTSNRSYYQIKDSTDVNNNMHQTYSSIDTGIVSKSFINHKLGANLFYSLRYPLGNKWLLTASTILSYQTWRSDEFAKKSTINQFDVKGLVSEVSLFYRF